MPLFLLFFQEIYSGEGPFPAQILGFRRQAKAKNSKNPAALTTAHI